MATHTVTDPKKHFYLKDGGSLSSLDELFAELQTMEGHVWDHHTNQGRNDFATWVRDVMEDRFLAKNIELAKEKDDLLKLLFINLFR
jgi:hypothetical protein